MCPGFVDTAFPVAAREFYTNLHAGWGSDRKTCDDGRIMKQIVPILTCALLLLAGSGARAGDRHLVELFTSQGCSSCPPADRVLGKLIDSRDDIVALELHVDYWDDLVYGLAGRWPDPFSDSAYSQRQRRYKSRGLAGSNGVYTPQVVVDGRAAVVGSNSQAIEELLSGPPPGKADLVLEHGPESMRVAVSGEAGGKAEVWLYRFDVRAVTRIEGGENKGMTLTNHHVVREARRLGDWPGSAREYVVENPGLEEGQGCAVVVQRPGPGEVLGAALCPS